MLDLNESIITMIKRSVFHVDCCSIIPECQFQCAKCLQEIQSVLDKIDGVRKFYTRGEAENTKCIVEHDSSKVTVKQVIDTIERLPSFYKGFFVAELLEAQQLDS